MRASGSTCKKRDRRGDCCDQGQRIQRPVHHVGFHTCQQPGHILDSCLLVLHMRVRISVLNMCVQLSCLQMSVYSSCLHMCLLHINIWSHRNQYVSLRTHLYQSAHERAQDIQKLGCMSAGCTLKTRRKNVVIIKEHFRACERIWC